MILAPKGCRVCATRHRQALSSRINTMRSGFKRPPQQRSIMRAMSPATDMTAKATSPTSYTRTTPRCDTPTTPPGFPKPWSRRRAADRSDDIVSDFDYGPHGQVTYKAFGNGVESTYTFDATKLYRLQNILTIASRRRKLGFRWWLRVPYRDESCASSARNSNPRCRRYARECARPAR